VTLTPRGFPPPPWTIEEHELSFIVRDANGQALGYFYFRPCRQYVLGPMYPVLPQF